jgi:hypothetical protein
VAGFTLKQATTVRSWQKADTDAQTILFTLARRATGRVPFGFTPAMHGRETQFKFQ